MDVVIHNENKCLEEKKRSVAASVFIPIGLKKIFSDVFLYCGVFALSHVFAVNKQ